MAKELITKLSSEEVVANEKEPNKKFTSTWKNQKSPKNDLHAVLDHYRHLPVMTLRRFGIVLLYLLTVSPTLIRRSCRRQLNVTEIGNSTTLSGSRGDLLPLPVTLTDEDELILQQLSTDASLANEDALCLRETVDRCWTACVTLILNHLYLSPQSEAGEAGEKIAWASPGSKLTATKNQCHHFKSDTSIC